MAKWPSTVRTLPLATTESHHRHCSARWPACCAPSCIFVCLFAGSIGLVGRIGPASESFRNSPAMSGAPPQALIPNQTLKPRYPRCDCARKGHRCGHTLRTTWQHTGRIGGERTNPDRTRRFQAGSSTICGAIFYTIPHNHSGASHWARHFYRHYKTTFPKSPS